MIRRHISPQFRSNQMLFCTAQNILIKYKVTRKCRENANKLMINAHCTLVLRINIQKYIVYCTKSASLKKTNKYQCLLDKKTFLNQILIHVCVSLMCTETCPPGLAPLGSRNRNKLKRETARNRTIERKREQTEQDLY